MNWLKATTDMVTAWNPSNLHWNYIEKDLQRDLKEAQLIELDGKRRLGQDSIDALHQSMNTQKERGA